MMKTFKILRLIKKGYLLEFYFENELLYLAYVILKTLITVVKKIICFEVDPNSIAVVFKKM